MAFVSFLSACRLSSRHRTIAPFLPLTQRPSISPRHAPSRRASARMATSGSDSASAGAIAATPRGAQAIFRVYLRRDGPALSLVARRGFSDCGRGAIFLFAPPEASEIDERQFLDGIQKCFVPLTDFEGTDGQVVDEEMDEIIEGSIRKYNPQKQFVVVLESDVTAEGDRQATTTVVNFSDVM